MRHNTIKIRNFIGGRLQKPVSNRCFGNEDPATGRVYSEVPDSDARDLEIAVRAAKKAFPVWRDMTPAARAKIMHRLADLIEEKQADFIRAESIDNGKPISLSAAVDIPRGIANLRFFADFAKNFEGEHFKGKASDSYTLRPPLGVVAVISPWNLPLLLFTWKLAPALAAGNCVIAKPSEVTPMTAFMLSELVNKAGFPPGVLNVLHGKGPKIGAAITEHPDIAAVSFTGGTATGTAIYKAAAPHLKKISLELGGKNPTIVFADADFKKALEGALLSAFANQGQVCLCGSRLLVQKSIYAKFRKSMIERTKGIVIGDPLDLGTQHGATVSKQHMEKVLGYIDLAKKEGGKILCGGKRRILKGRCKDGYFIEPTIIESLPSHCRTNQEEIFGPVVTLIPFKDEEEAIKIANSTQYGLAASIWTKNKTRAGRVAARIDSGIIWLNCWNVRDLATPFGGMKKSGIGREGGARALSFFTEEKTVTSLK